jgi:hypothetical protein
VCVCVLWGLLVGGLENRLMVRGEVRLKVGIV